MDNEYSCNWQQPAEKLHEVGAAGEELLRHAGAQAGAEFSAAKKRLEAAIADVRESARTLEQKAALRARAAGAQADRYVRQHPWEVMGYGAAAAGVAGLALGLLLGRR